MSWRRWLDETFTIEEIVGWDLLFMENDDVIYRNMAEEWWSDETD